jgi:hypothetical protein
MGHRVEVSGHAVELSEDNWAMDGEAEPGQWGRKAQLGLWGFASASWAYTEWPEVFKYIHYSPLRPGPQTVRVPVDVRVYEPPPGFKHLATWDPAAQRPLVETTIELTQSWELIREGDPYLVRKDDPSLRPAVEGAIEVIPEACTPGSPGWRNWELRAVAHNPPVGLSFKVSVRAGGREWKVRPEDFTCAAGGTELEIWRFALPDSAGDRVDVILRPDPEAGRFDNRVEYWDGEVVIRGVRLKPEVR